MTSYPNGTTHIHPDLICHALKLNIKKARTGQKDDDHVSNQKALAYLAGVVIIRPRDFNHFSQDNAAHLLWLTCL